MDFGLAPARAGITFTRMMRPVIRAFAAFLVLVTVLLSWGTARAANTFTPPPLNGHVVDTAGALTPQEVKRLDAKLDQARKQTGFAVVVLTLASLPEGMNVEDVAYETFNTWQVGATAKDDGVLLVIAPDQRKMRIETGKGVGDRLTDVQSSRIIRELLTPRLQKKDYEGAVEDGTRAIERALTGEDPVVTPAPTKTPGRATRKSVPLTSTQKWVIGGVVVLVIFLAIVSRGFRRVLFSILEVLVWAALMGRGGGGGGGGSGGGGGYSGGGGRSGGGGASGGW